MVNGQAGMPYLDIVAPGQGPVRRAHLRVSGERRVFDAEGGCGHGWLDERAVVMEALLGFQARRRRRRAQLLRTAGRALAQRKRWLRRAGGNARGTNHKHPPGSPPVCNVRRQWRPLLGLLGCDTASVRVPGLSLAFSATTPGVRASSHTQEALFVKRRKTRVHHIGEDVAKAGWPPARRIPGQRRAAALVRSAWSIHHAGRNLWCREYVERRCGDGFSAPTFTPSAPRLAGSSVGALPNPGYQFYRSPATEPSMADDIGMCHGRRCRVFRLVRDPTAGRCDARWPTRSAL